MQHAVYAVEKQHVCSGMTHALSERLMNLKTAISPQRLGDSLARRCASACRRKGNHGAKSNFGDHQKGKRK